MQYLSPELSKRLTELTQENIAEIIQNKRYYVESKDRGIMVVCGHRIKWGEDSQELKVICPAWQVEDVLRNLAQILGYVDLKRAMQIGEHITYLFWVNIESSSTVYQKIEEYLWSIFRID